MLGGRDGCCVITHLLSWGGLDLAILEYTEYARTVI